MKKIKRAKRMFFWLARYVVWLRLLVHYKKDYKRREFFCCFVIDSQGFKTIAPSFFILSIFIMMCELSLHILPSSPSSFFFGHSICVSAKMKMINFFPTVRYKFFSFLFLLYKMWFSTSQGKLCFLMIICARAVSFYKGK